jgi:hypothetical protein
MYNKQQYSDLRFIKNYNSKNKNKEEFANNEIFYYIINSDNLSVTITGLVNKTIAINNLTIDWENPDENSIEFYPDGTPKFNGID